MALSLVPPIDAPLTDAELGRLGRLLAGRTRIVAGGAAGPAHRPALEAAGATLVRDLAGLRSFLHVRGARSPR